MKTAFCFDLDGTISSLEILPCIAAELGIADEIATLTRLTMDGHIPFTDSLRLRTLILGQIPLDRVHAIIDAIQLDCDLLSFLDDYRSDCFIVTGNLDLWVAPLLQRLGCGWHCTTARHVDGRIVLDSILDKGEVVRQLRAQGQYDRIVAIGDGANDVPMLREADVAIAYGGVHPPTQATAAAASLIINDPETLCTLLKAL